MSEQCRDAWFTDPAKIDRQPEWTHDDWFVARFHRCVLPDTHPGAHRCECGDVTDSP